MSRLSFLLACLLAVGCVADPGVRLEPRPAPPSRAPALAPTLSASAPAPAPPPVEEEPIEIVIKGSKHDDYDDDGPMVDGDAAAAHEAWVQELEQEARESQGKYHGPPPRREWRRLHRSARPQPQAAPNGAPAAAPAAPDPAPAPQPAAQPDTPPGNGGPFLATYPDGHQEWVFTLAEKAQIENPPPEKGPFLATYPDHHQEWVFTKEEKARIESGQE